MALTVPGIAEIFVVQVILCFRLHAMYGQTRRMLVFLTALLFSTCVGTVVALAVQLSKPGLFGAVTNSPPGQDNIVVCFVPVKVQSFALVAIPVIAFDTIAFAYMHLTTKIKVNISVRDNVHVSALVQPAWHGPRLLRILVRDSMLYFVMICAVYVVNALIWRYQPTASSLVATGWSLTLLSVAGNRMLLSLREAREEDLARPPTLQTSPESVDDAGLQMAPLKRQEITVGVHIHPAGASKTRLFDTPLTHAMYNI
ncbi:hypothetical protein EXIGLDRAFT_828558 [Exidia glandulosa HHB12029]|uniref:Uncharacterized protein n=1 Tax=Exidia glandulosa HHB12029 TaxID=1314781 RepID=A0A166BQE0_EXIGL|nr:hypothetical protein EXIGLDRAFT_828558 [Exidia glandulosa HHB12029]